MDVEEKVTALVIYLRKHNLNDWTAIAAFLHKNSNKLEAKNETLKKRIKAAEAANKLDCSRIPNALTTLSAAVLGRQWVLEGRGLFEWDNENYRAEFNLWVDDVKNAADRFTLIASDWHECSLQLATGAPIEIIKSQNLRHCSIDKPACIVVLLDRVDLWVCRSVMVKRQYWRSSWKTQQEPKWDCCQLEWLP